MCGVQSNSTGSSTSSSARAAAVNASTSKKPSAKKAAKSAKKAAKQQGKSVCSSAAQPWLDIAQGWACGLFGCALICTEMQSDLLDGWKMLDWLEVWTEGLPTGRSTALR